MKLIELPSNGQLTRNVVDEVGDEFAIPDRLRRQIFGIGHLRYTSGNETLDALYDQLDRTIKAHFDWTEKGAVVRIRTMSKLYAIPLTEAGFQSIKLTKEPDYIFAIPFMPFWFLLKLGIPFRIAKWFKIRGDQFVEGDCELRIEHKAAVLNFALTGDMWSDCLATFDTARSTGFSVIEDRRTWMTENGFRINGGQRSSAMRLMK